MLCNPKYCFTFVNQKKKTENLPYRLLIAYERSDQTNYGGPAHDPTGLR